MRPIFIVVAGVMGTGKSVFIREKLSDFLNVALPGRETSLRILNVDERGKDTFKHEAINMTEETSWVEAARDVERIVDASIDARSSIGVETVLSSDKYRKRLAKARANSYLVVSIYLAVQEKDLLKRRIKDREAAGGHGADFTRFESDWRKSHENAAWLWAHSDSFFAFDVSEGKNSRAIAAKYNDVEPFINTNSACSDCVQTLSSAHEILSKKSIEYVLNAV